MSIVKKLECVLSRGNFVKLVEKNKGMPLALVVFGEHWRYSYGTKLSMRWRRKLDRGEIFLGFGLQSDHGAWRTKLVID